MSLTEMTEAPKPLVEVEATFGRILAFQNDLATRQILEFGNHPRPEVAFFLSVVSAGDAVFDLGAHIGTFTFPLANKVGDRGRVLAVEGSEENFSVISINVERLRTAAEVTLSHAIVSFDNSQREARRQSGNTGASFFVPASAGNTARAEAVSLDDLFRRYFLPRVIKIDIEGMEFAVLQASALIKKIRPIIYAEVSSEQLGRAGASIEQLAHFFDRQGYNLFRNVGDRNARHDNFIVAELSNLAEGGAFFDVLAIHAEDERLGAMKLMVSQDFESS